VGRVYPILIESPMIRTFGRPFTSSIGVIGLTRFAFFDWAFVNVIQVKRRGRVRKMIFFIKSTFREKRS
jgi:hypothetical protein